MTNAGFDDDALADRIADRGRELLIEGLNRAYASAAATHADIVSVTPERIEAMVQAAAQRADGLQWRRALARAAVEELGVSLPDALVHPKVAEAQRIVGAPPYESELAEWITGSATSTEAVLPNHTAPGAEAASPPEAESPPEAQPPTETEPPTEVAEAMAPAPDPEPTEDPRPLIAEPLTLDVVIEEDPLPAPPQPEPVIEEPELHGHTDELVVVEADAELLELLPPPEPTEGAPESETDDTPAAEPALTPDDQPIPPEAVYGGEHADYPPSEDQELRVPARHLGGVANLPHGHKDFDLRLSEHGLDILEPAGEVIGRLHWNEIDAVQVSTATGLFRRRPNGNSRILVRTRHGDARFEITGQTEEELRTRVEPLLSRFGNAGTVGE
ncbi:MAG: hypothetical protein ACRDKL_04730 [Solirubrobacteraceae bacterium]